jgi:hypothetical protein
MLLRDYSSGINGLSQETPPTSQTSNPAMPENRTAKSGPSVDNGGYMWPIDGRMSFEPAPNYERQALQAEAESISLPAIEKSSLDQHPSPDLERMASLGHCLNHSNIPEQTVEQYPLKSSTRRSVLRKARKLGSKFPKPAPGSQNSPDEAIHPIKSPTSLTPSAFTALSELHTLLDSRHTSIFSYGTVSRILRLYQSLPQPRVCYLTLRHIITLLTLLTRQNTLLRFISRGYNTIVDDIKQNGTRLGLHVWTSLIDMAGKDVFSQTKGTATQKALALFQAMQQSGVLADEATLTSLFQSANHNGNRELSAALDLEIRKRWMDNNLLIWTDRFKQAGKENDIGRINAVFESFAKTGISMDIVLINEVLAAILETGHLPLAELIYLRLRSYVLSQLGENEVPAAPGKAIVRKERKAFVKTLQRQIADQQALEWALRQRRIDREDIIREDGTANMFFETLRGAMDNSRSSYAATLIPQYGTLRLFVRYHCHYTGRMSDVVFYLSEMQRFRISPLYGTYVDLFHGFYTWHTSLDVDWTSDRLDQIFSTIRKGVQEGKPPIPVTYALVLTAIRAFGKIKGGKGAREVWDLLRPWIRANENVRDKNETKLLQLERLVVAFEEEDGDLGWGFKGDAKWRYLD